MVPCTGKKCISVRWVLAEKYIDRMRNVKARLVAKGFEESISNQDNSPTCSKDVLKLMFASLFMYLN